MNDLLKLHKVTGGRGTNEFIYKESLDEHFNTGELNNVKAENDRLYVNPFLFKLKGNTIEDSSIVASNVTIVKDDTKGDVMNFNGPSSKITTKDSLPFNKDFTIDLWVWIDSNAKMNFGRILYGSSGQFSVEYNKPNKLIRIIGATNTTNNYIDIPITSYLNTWMHLAFVMKNSELKIYLDGELKATHPFRPLTYSRMDIGWQNITTPEYFTGKICNVRFSPIILWENNFNPNEEPYNKFEGYRISPPINLPNDIISSKINWDGEGRISIGKDAGVIQDTNTKLYLKGDEIKDISKYNNEIENPNNAIKVIEDSSKGCVYDFKEGANELKLGNPIDINEDWTIDYYIKFKKSVTSHTPILGNVGKLSTNPCSLGFMEIGSSKFNYLFHTKKATANWDKRLGALHALNINKWEHIAIVKKGWDVSVYVDGVSKGKLNLGADLKEVGEYFSIGTWRAETLKTPFSLSNMRFSDKALWESNFTPPLLTLKDTCEFKECTKDARLNLDSNEILLKEELEGEETISNVQLDVKHKPKKETMKPGQLLPPPIPKDGLTLHLDGSIGCTTKYWRDLTNNYTVSLYNNPQPLNNECLRFDGINQYGIIESLPRLTTFTMIVKFKRLGNKGQVICNQDNGGYNINMCSTGCQSNPYLGGGYNDAYTFNLLPNEIGVVSIAYSPNNYRLYNNGMLLQSLAKTLTYPSTNTPMALGANPNTNTSNATSWVDFGNCDIYEVLYYNKLLSEDEIKQISNTLLKK